MLDYYNPDDLDVRVAELLVATADGADRGTDPKIQEVLRLLREKLGMDVVFVSEFIDGNRVFRFVDLSPSAPKIQPGMADPLEATWCQRVVDGRLPEFIREAQIFVNSGDAPDPGIEIGTFISAPIVTKGGRIFGTLCCFSAHMSPTASAEDLKRLKYSAQMLADKLDQTKDWPELPKA